MQLETKLGALAVGGFGNIAVLEQALSNYVPLFERVHSIATWWGTVWLFTLDDVARLMALGTAPVMLIATALVIRKALSKKGPE